MADNEKKKKKTSIYGNEILIQKAMDFSISSNWGKYKVSIINISSDLLILLADVRNKFRLMHKDYYMYTSYEKINVELFTGNRDNCEDTTIYEFFINSVSKTKVSLTLVEGEEAEDYVRGEEFTESERERLDENDLNSFIIGLNDFKEKTRKGYRKTVKIRWNKN